MFRSLALIVLTLLLTACGGGGPVKRINPPQISIREARLHDDGRVDLMLNVHNHSTVTMQFSRFEMRMQFDGMGLAHTAETDLRIGAQSSETLTLNGLREPVLTEALAALSAGRIASVRYIIEGRAYSSEPSGMKDFLFESRLNPTPGLPNVFR